MGTQAKAPKFDQNKSTMDKKRASQSKNIDIKKTDFSNSKNIRRLYNDFL